MMLSGEAPRASRDIGPENPVCASDGYSTPARRQGSPSGRDTIYDQALPAWPAGPLVNHQLNRPPARRR